MLFDIFTESENLSQENLTKRSSSEHQSKRPSSSLSLQSSSSELSSFDAPFYFL